MCVNLLSQEIPEINQLTREEGIFWLIDSDFLVHSHSAQLLQVYVDTGYCRGSTCWGRCVSQSCPEVNGELRQDGSDIPI